MAHVPGILIIYLSSFTVNEDVIFEGNVSVFVPYVNRFCGSIDDVVFEPGISGFTAEIYSPAGTATLAIYIVNEVISYDYVGVADEDAGGVVEYLRTVIYFVVFDDKPLFLVSSA